MLAEKYAYLEEVAPIVEPQRRSQPGRRSKFTRNSLEQLLRVSLIP